MLHRLQAAQRPASGTTAATLLGLVVAAGLFAVLYPWFPGSPPLEEGTVAPYTITSPRDLSFTSEHLTAEAREAAAESVPDRVQFDPGVRARALEDLSRQLSAINGVRTDPSLAESARESAIAEIAGTELTQRAAAALATATDEEWELLSEEAREVLSRTLTGPVAADEVEDARQRAADLLSSTLTSDQQVALVQLLRPLIEPTLVVDEGLTQTDRAEARSNQPPVRVSIARGEVLVEDGELIGPATSEAIDVAGLRADAARVETILSAALVALLGGTAVAGYLIVAKPDVLRGLRRMTLYALLLLLTAAVIKVTLSLTLPDVDRQFIAYALPVAAAPMAAAVLLDIGPSLLLVMLLSAIAGFVSVQVPLADVAGNADLESARLWLAISASSLAGIYFAAHADRLSAYLAAGLGAGVATFTAAVAIWLLDPQRETVDLAWLAGAALGGGVLAALIAVGAFVALSRPFGIITRVELMELAQLSHPLLRRLQDEAPGTFQHSLLVGSLAERAADRIGADPLLARIGAYYHDIGKLVAPSFFVENFGAGENPHESLDPLQSTRLLHQHVTAGVELARREGLPSAVAQFIPQHHGTRLTTFFYRRAAEEDPEIDPELFRYPGPRPRSREAALVMLADSCEATVRALSERTAERIRESVEETIKERIDEGQFDECPITLRDLHVTAEAFISTLNAVYHPRVEYPQPTERELAARGRGTRPERAEPSPAADAEEPDFVRPPINRVRSDPDEERERGRRPARAFSRRRQHEREEEPEEPLHPELSEDST